MDTSSLPVKSNANMQSDQTFLVNTTNNSSLHSPELGIHKVGASGSPQSSQESNNLVMALERLDLEIPLSSRRVGARRNEVRLDRLDPGSKSSNATHSTSGQVASTAEPGKDKYQQIDFDCFEKKLMTLANIEPSKYTRRYPSLGTTTMRLTRSDSTEKKFAIFHQELRESFKKDLKSKEFCDYLIKNKIPTNFNDASIPISEPLKLEVDVHFLFRQHPTLKNISFCSAYPYSLIFPDDDIWHMYCFEPEKSEIVQGVEIFYTKNDKPIIQQQTISPSSSAAAVAAMLAYERGIAINVERLSSAYTAACNSAEMIRELKYYGLDCIGNCLDMSSKSSSMSQLTLAIESHGSAVVLLFSRNHQPVWVLVDKADVVSGKVRCRNPFNCEELEVKLQTFCNIWSTAEGFIQVNNTH